jgi:hypothetical protein
MVELDVRAEAGTYRFLLSVFFLQHGSLKHIVVQQFDLVCYNQAAQIEPQ